jgi:hypothetical protein
LRAPLISLTPADFQAGWFGSVNFIFLSQVPNTLQTLLKQPVCRSVSPTGQNKRSYTMAQNEHNKAAEHHESAAKSHRQAAEQHGKNDNAKGQQHAGEAQKHSKTAHEHSEKAHGASQQQK